MRCEHFAAFELAAEMQGEMCENENPFFLLLSLVDARKSQNKLKVTNIQFTDFFVTIDSHSGFSIS